MADIVKSFYGLWTNNFSFDQVIQKQKQIGNTIGLMNGCFDLLHAGHIDGIRQTKEEFHVEFLIVAVNSDASVENNRGRKPFVGSDNRCAALAQLPWVDAVVTFDEETPLELIQTVKPHVLFKGEEWVGKGIAGQQVVEKNDGRLVFVKNNFKIHSTDIVNKVLENVEVGVIIVAGKLSQIHTETPVFVKILDVSNRWYDFVTPDQCISNEEAKKIPGWETLQARCYAEANRHKTRQEGL